MSIQLRDGTGAALLQVGTNMAARTSAYLPDVDGTFRLCAPTGLLTVVAAGTSSAGHLFAFRWSHASKKAIITHFRARWFTIAGFTAAQEVGMDLFMTRSYSANHSGGTAVGLTADNMKKRTADTDTQIADARIATTGALTNSSPVSTLATSPIAQGSFAELAAAATVPKGVFEIGFTPNDPAYQSGIVLRTNEGLILRNSILMGAGGTARVIVEMDWHEVDTI